MALILYLGLLHLLAVVLVLVEQLMVLLAALVEVVVIMLLAALEPLIKDTQVTQVKILATLMLLEAVAVQADRAAIHQTIQQAVLGVVE
jgi:hypothetical protein